MIVLKHRVPTHFNLLITHITIKIGANETLKVKTSKETFFSRFSYYLNKYWFDRKTFLTKVVVCKNGVCIHTVIKLITEYYSSVKCLQFSDLRRGDRGTAVAGFYISLLRLLYALNDFVIH